jgi:hypothetical protein
MAAYRFFDNEAVDWRAILGAHRDCAMTRIAAHEVALCIQDTTELDFNGQEASGLGPLNYEAQRGMYAHPTYAVSTSREPLGVPDAWMWGREAKDKDGSRPRVKESMRWVEGYQRLVEMAADLPGTRLVYAYLSWSSFSSTPLKLTSGVALRKSCSCAIVRSLVSFMLITILG